VKSLFAVRPCPNEANKNLNDRIRRSMPTDGIDMTQWRLLASLAENHSLSAAAAKIGISQSAASHALAKLRLQVGDALFVRSSGRMKPTPYGVRLCEAARDALDTLLDGLTFEHSFDPAETRRRFNVCTNTIGQLACLPQLVALLKREAPGASLKVHQPTENTQDALASGEVDLAVGGFFTNLTSGFRQSVLYRTRYVCVVRADHPLFRDGMTMDAFLKVSHAVTDASGMAHAIVERALPKNSVQHLVHLSVPDFVALPILVAESDLLVTMPAGLANAFATHLRLKILPPPLPLPEYDVKVYWHERFQRDPANMWLRQAFVQLFRSNDPARVWNSEFAGRRTIAQTKTQ
jgi:DNA-binding transcriptional LysR family regulator